MKNKIIVATDFSDNAKTATNWAAYLANQLKAELHLFHCYHIPVLVNDVPFPAGNEMELEKGLNELMKAEQGRLQLLYPEINVATRIEPGFTNESIQQYADKHHASLLVLGITGRNPLGQYLIGSTAVTCALHAKIPVLVVPVDARTKSIKTIAFALDHGIEQIKDLIVLVDLAKTFDAGIEIVHVTSSNDKAEDAILKTDYEKTALKDLRYSVHSVNDPEVEEGLKYFVSRYRADLMVVVHQRHGFFDRMFNRSHTGKLAYQLEIPLLVLHE